MMAASFKNCFLFIILPVLQSLDGDFELLLLWSVVEPFAHGAELSLTEFCTKLNGIARNFLAQSGANVFNQFVQVCRRGSKLTLRLDEASFDGHHGSGLTLFHESLLNRPGALENKVIRHGDKLRVARGCCCQLALLLFPLHDSVDCQKHQQDQETSSTSTSYIDGDVRGGSCLGC